MFSYQKFSVLNGVILYTVGIFSSLFMSVVRQHENESPETPSRLCLHIPDYNESPLQNIGVFYSFNELYRILAGVS